MSACEIAGQRSAVCAFCERTVPQRLVSLHHLLPKSKGGRADVRVPLCKPCHRQIHATFTNTQLAREFPTVAALRDAEPMRAFLAWIRKQKPDRNFSVVMSSGHPGAKAKRLRQRCRSR